MNRRFVVAFNRDRDHYQVPLALQEAGLLETLVTDLYCSGRGIASLFPYLKLVHRQVPGLPADRVKQLNLTALYQIVHNAIRPGSRLLIDRVDATLSRGASKVARKSNADLLLYSQYAREAFRDPDLIARRKGLFVFHPHHRLVRSILSDDCARNPNINWSIDREASLQFSRSHDRLNEECALADFFICASTFTRRSLINHGIQARTIGIAPYGTDREVTRLPLTKGISTTNFLFVGQGIQRKGIHHLLTAWRRLDIKAARLRIVCSRVDPCLRRLIDHPTIDFSAAISRKELDRLFTTSHVFVMPSLVEGFGLVYLEALASGCYTIGTTNTGLPDLGVPQHFASTIEAGNIDELSRALEIADQLHKRSEIDHQAIQKFARTRQWLGFRKAVVSQLHNLCT